MRCRSTVRDDTARRRRGREWRAQRSPDREPDRRDRTVDCRGGGRATRSTTPKLVPGVCAAGWDGSGGGAPRCARTRFLRARAGTVVVTCTRTRPRRACVRVGDWWAGPVPEIVGGAGALPAAIDDSPPPRRRCSPSSSEPPPLINGAHRRRSSPTRAVIRGGGGGGRPRPFAPRLRGAARPFRRVRGGVFCTDRPAAGRILLFTRAALN